MRDRARRRPARGRGRTATHDLETLLDLAAAVARAAVDAGEAAAPTLVSMPVFNRVKVDVDRARGIADPQRDPERTPTADSIQMRLKGFARRPVRWEDVLDGSLRAGRERTMWLSALRREEPRTELTDRHVIHALRLVAARLGVQTLTRGQYESKRDELVAADGDGLLERLLPTVNQVLAHCELRWEKALTLGGLQPPARHPASGRPRPRMNAILGMPVAHVTAIYAALNGTWPSKVALYRFATCCGIRMADPAGSTSSFRDAAAQLLTAEGVPVPGPPKALGKGVRLTFRYPAGGIPGAPLRDPAARREQLRKNSRLKELQRELCVVSLCAWLAGLSASDRRTHSGYVRWATGNTEGWLSASAFGKNGRGGFSALKREAAQENARVRRAGGDPLADARERADALKTEVTAIYAAGAVRQPDPVPFSEALQAVLAGPHAEAVAPKQ